MQIASYKDARSPFLCVKDAHKQPLFFVFFVKNDKITKNKKNRLTKLLLFIKIYVTIMMGKRFIRHQREPSGGARRYAECCPAPP